MTAQSHLAQNLRPGAMLPCFLRILAASVFIAIPLLATAQQPASSPTAQQVTAHKPVHHRKLASTAQSATSSPKPASTPIAPIAPKPPDWPANNRPTEATVVWNSQGLHIEASNSTLGQILKDVATATGAKVEGLGQDQHIADQRIFGSYGPGKARDVLMQLLEGSGYNLLMIGDQGQGTPREIVLSTQPTGAASPAINGQQDANDDNTEADDQPQPQPPPQAPPNMRNGLAPGAPPRTPQQIMQEMQQRQQQVLQTDTPQ